MHNEEIGDVEDILNLEDLFDDLGIHPTRDQLYKMYGVYLKDIVNNPLIVNGKSVKYNNGSSRHPVCQGKHLTFEHIITRESKYSGKRNFDSDRANKLHWIRPIIESVDDHRILYFEKIHDGNNQLFYWYKAKGFLIILREVKPDLILITSFSVDQLERKKYDDWHKEYDKQKKTSLRK